MVLGNCFITALSIEMPFTWKPPRSPRNVLFVCTVSQSDTLMELRRDRTRRLLEKRGLAGQAPADASVRRKAMRKRCVASVDEVGTLDDTLTRNQ